MSISQIKEGRFQTIAVYLTLRLDRSSKTMLRSRGKILQESLTRPGKYSLPKHGTLEKKKYHPEVLTVYRPLHIFEVVSRMLQTTGRTKVSAPDLNELNNSFCGEKRIRSISLGTDFVTSILRPSMDTSRNIQISYILTGDRKINGCAPIANDSGIEST